MIIGVLIEHFPLPSNGQALTLTFELPNVDEARSLISLVRLEDFASEPRQIVDADFAFLPRNRDQDILPFQHLHLEETPPENLQKRKEL